LAGQHGCAGEIRCVARCLGAGVDVAALLEVGKGQAGVEPADLVRVGRDVPTQKHHPVIPCNALRRSGMGQDIGGTVDGQRIVEDRLLDQVIDLPYIVQEQETGLGWRDVCVIQIDLLRWPPVRGTQANHIAFVCDDVDEFILLENPLDGRVVLRTFFADLSFPIRRWSPA
jgi:hypothetical protein